jgi:hypothetical protein
MKAIVNGLIYDTEDAHHIGDGGTDAPIGNFHRAWEALYRTESGRFFLAGEGGPMTRWAETLPDGARKDGSGIIPLSEAEALSWAEANLRPNIVIEVFGERIERA